MLSLHFIVDYSPLSAAENEIRVNLNKSEIMLLFNSEGKGALYSGNWTMELDTTEPMISTMTSQDFPLKGMLSLHQFGIGGV